MNIDDDSVWLSQPEQRYRYLTCILYVTPDNWNVAEDGGALRVYLGCEENDQEVRGTIICFEASSLSLSLSLSISLS